MLLKGLFNKDAAGQRKSHRGAHWLEPVVAENPQADKLSPVAVRPAPIVVAVLGAKGGVGATTLAVNLAAALGLQGHQSTLLDANFQQPDAATVVGCESRYSLVDLIARLDDIDRRLFETCSTSLAESGIPMSLLSPPLDGTAGVRLTLSQLAECLGIISKYSDFWVIDMPKHLDKHFVTLLDACDRVVLVFEPTIPGVAACRRWLNTLSQLGYEKNKIVCVLNRVGSQYPSVEKQVTSCFAEQQIFRLPNAYGISWECVTKGKPSVCLYPKHAYSLAVSKLSEYLTAVKS